MNNMAKGGYIVFKHPRALNHLLTKGVVYTLRRFNRSKGVVELRTDKGGPSIAEVFVELVGFVKSADGKYVVQAPDGSETPLDEYVKESGFDTVEEWIDAYKKLHKYRSANQARLFRVKLLKREVSARR